MKVEMPNDNKILKYHHREKSLKALFMIYADLECLLEKMHSCQNNLEKSYTEKKIKHTPSGLSLFKSCSFNPTKNKLDFYKGEDCMESLCEIYKNKYKGCEEKRKIKLICNFIGLENNKLQMQRM